jgi:O-antigen ligase
MLTRFPAWVKWSWICAFGIGLVSAALSDYPRFALIEWVSFLLLLWLALLWAGQVSRSNDLDKWIQRLIIAVAVVIAVKVMASYLGSIIPRVKLDSTILFTEGFSNRRFFGQVATVLIPLLAYPLLNENLGRIKRVSVFLLLSIWWMLAIASGTRGTWLALALASGLLLIGARRTGFPWLKLQAKAFVLGISLFVLLFIWIPQLLQLNTSIENRLADITGLSGREVLWNTALEQIQTHPLLGIGPMHLAAIRNGIAAHPHNSALQLMAEWGIPASLALTMPLAIGLISLLRMVRKLPEGEANLLVCLLAALLATTTQSMVDGVIVMPYTQLWLVITGGWALGTYYRVIPQKSDCRVSRHVPWVAPVVSITGLALLLGCTSPEIMNWHETIQRYVDEGSFLPPRYWVRGWIPTGQ